MSRGRSSNRLRRKFRREATLRVTLSAGMPHARFVEFGTKRMKARPYLRPGMASVMAYVRNQFDRRILPALRRAGWK